MSFFAIIGINNAQVKITSTGTNTVTSTATINLNNGIGNTLNKITTGSDNNAFGANALLNTTTGKNNTAIGRSCLINNSTGSQNNSIGYTALYNNISGNFNSALGTASLYNNKTGDFNTAYGGYSGYNLGLSGIKNSNNTFVGYKAGYDVDGNNNTIIGANILGASNLNNHVIIGDGSGNQRIFINNSGNMGIGTTTPTAKVEIAGGDLKVSTNRILAGNSFSNWILSDNNFSIIANKSVIIEGNGDGSVQHLEIANKTINAAGQFGLAGGDGYHSNIAKKGDVTLRASTSGSLILTNEGRTGGANDIKFVTQDNEPTSQVRMLIDKKGKILIGTETAPIAVGSDNVSAYKLFVKGGILTEEVRVRLSSDWADYVFNKNYQLKPLKEVEKFINRNGHLPNVPSAKEIKENGLELGNIVTIQQEKIEELTLYAIQQQKEIEELKALVKKLLDKQ